MRGYDAWVTRDPFDYPEPKQPHCPHCGAFLPFEPQFVEQKEQTEHCDGKMQVFENVYTKDDAGVLDIIGWDFLGHTYFTEFDPPCGKHGEHEPHEAVMQAWSELHWTCKACGKDAVIVDA